MQPGAEHFERSMGSNIAQFEAGASATWCGSAMYGP